ELEEEELAGEVLERERPLDVEPLEALGEVRGVNRFVHGIGRRGRAYCTTTVKRFDHAACAPPSSSRTCKYKVGPDGTVHGSAARAAASVVPVATSWTVPVR